MNRKQLLLRILYVLLGLTVVAAVVGYLVLPPLLGGYVAMCAVVLVVNFLLSIFFVNKNLQ